MARKNQFEKGNTASKGLGGKRPGAGRKPDVVRQALDDLLNRVQTVKGANRRTLVQLAGNTIVQAMLDRDSYGRVTAAGVKAAEIVWDRAFGKPRQTVELTGRGENLMALLSDDERAAAEGKLKDVLMLQPAPTPPAKPV